MQSRPPTRPWPWALALLLAVCGCRAAGAELGKETREDDPPSLGEVMEDAFAGDALSQLKLGLMYEQRESFTNAARWYRKSAEQGNADAQYKLGFLHTTGQGVPRDYAAAAKWFRQAADQGMLSAQYNLAVCCEKGYGGPTNYTEALTWYRKAAERGEDYAQKAIGVFYEKGKGVPVDWVEAQKWYLLSAARGNPDALKLRNLLRPRLTPAQIAESERRYAAYAASLPGGALINAPSTPPKPRSKPKDFLE